ncbi:YehS family protein [Legionella saoudiensis]|uniref:DUF1456 family protein n=1 Tax=Legionella saoudiensis TaxID=1750561 RepID=UPI000731DA66|nr:DUF1456 family protein [Legionella saoudiensis]
MTNNDFFRQMLHLTGVGKDKDLLIELFKLGGITATPSKIKGWRTDLDNPRASMMPDHVLQGFIQGLFEYRDIKMKEGLYVFNFIQKK